MEEKFLCGIALGMIGGALLTAYSSKTREAVKSGAEQVKQKVTDMTKSKKSK